MIEVIIRIKGGKELGKITIENLVGEDTEYAEYSVRFGVDKAMGVGLHQRGIWGFPRRQYNVLALLLQALNTLEPEELKLHGDLNDKHRSLGWRHFFS